MLIVTVAFVFFRADTLHDGVVMIAHMFAGGAGNAASYQACVTALNPYQITLFVICIFASLPLIQKLRAWLAGKDEKTRIAYSRLSYVLTVVLLVLCILNVADATYNPFIYFRF